MIKVWMSGAMLTACLVSSAEDQPGAKRYKLILDREPFGSEPVVVETKPAVTPAAQEALAKELRLCMLLEGKNGDIRAGLVETKGEKKSLILSVGETVQGIKLLNVDIEKAQARIARNGVAVTFKLEKGVVPKPAPQPGLRETALRSGNGLRGLGSSGGKPRYGIPDADNIIRREPRLRGEELRNHLRDYQMEVIRKGAPPLPVPLTDEMDKQLVDEGVLPPIE